MKSAVGTIRLLLALAMLTPLAAWSNAGSPVTYSQNGQLMAELVSNGGTFDHLVGMGLLGGGFLAASSTHSIVGGVAVTPVGTPVSLGDYTANDELVFRLDNYDRTLGLYTGASVYSAPLPGIGIVGDQAASVTYSGGGLIATIGFDEVAGTGGPYDDLVFQLTLTPTAAVPEPSTYALMIAGLGLVGFVARRRRRS